MSKKKDKILFKINQNGYKSEETTLSPIEWAIEKGCLPESIHKELDLIFTGKTKNGDKITFWKG